MGSQSAAHRVLDIPELLDLVFRLLDHKSNLNNACVSHRWTDIGLNNLWRSVDSAPQIIHLFSKLAPLEYESAIGNCFTRAVTQADWANFAPYARRVRALTYEPSLFNTKEAIHHSVFAEISRTRTSFTIFPHLCVLSWHANDLATRPYSTLFMHDAVKELHLDIASAIGYTREAQVDDIISRLPSLESLYIAAELSSSTIPPLMPLFSIQGLKKISMERWLYTPSVLMALARLPNLEALVFDLSLESEDEALDMGLYPDLLDKPFGPDAFPALKEICLWTPLSLAKILLTGDSFLPKLSEINVCTRGSEENTAINDFLKAVADTYPDLEVLCLDVIESHVNPSVEPKQIGLDTLQPILRLKSLHGLEFRHNLPLKLDEEDVSRLAVSLPNLENLFLNAEPLAGINADEYPALPLVALVPLAQHCRKLKSLGVYIDGTAKDPSSDLHWPVPRFSVLRDFYVGVSPICEFDDIQPLALFLSHLLFGLQAPTLSVGVTWPWYMIDDAYKVLSRARYDRWEALKEMLPLLMKVREEEMVQRIDVEREVEDLRMRNELLTAHAKIRQAGDTVGPGGATCLLQ